MKLSARRARLAALLASAAVGLAAISLGFIGTVGCRSECVANGVGAMSIILPFAIFPLAGAILAHRIIRSVSAGRGAPPLLWMIALSWSFAALAGFVALFSSWYLLVSPYLHGPHVATALFVFALSCTAAAILSGVAAHQLTLARKPHNVGETEA